MSDINKLTQPFSPQSLNLGGGGTIAVSVTATSANIALNTEPTDGANPDTSAGPQIEIVNTSTTLMVFVEFGTNPTATIPAAAGANGSLPILPNSRRILTVLGRPAKIALIASGAGPTLVYITQGNGS